MSARDEKAVPARHGQQKGISPPQPTSDESEISDIAEAAEVADANPNTGLPFSKARCIALVATLAGASFLNVSRMSSRHLCFRLGHSPDHRACPARPWSSFSQS